MPAFRKYGENEVLIEEVENKTVKNVRFKEDDAIMILEFTDGTHSVIEAGLHENGRLTLLR